MSPFWMVRVLCLGLDLPFSRGRLIGGSEKGGGLSRWRGAILIVYGGGGGGGGDGGDGGDGRLFCWAFSGLGLGL